MGVKSGQTTKEKVWNLDTMDNTKGLLNSLVYTITQRSYKLGKNFPWEKVDLFINVFDEFCKDHEMTNRKVKPNDFYDLFNLAYVQPGDKYWTKEKYWNRLIERRGYSHYLLS